MTDEVPREENLFLRLLHILVLMHLLNERSCQVVGVCGVVAGFMRPIVRLVHGYVKLRLALLIGPFVLRRRLISVVAHLLREMYIDGSHRMVCLHEVATTLLINRADEVQQISVHVQLQLLGELVLRKQLGKHLRSIVAILCILVLVKFYVRARKIVPTALIMSSHLVADGIPVVMTPDASVAELALA